MCNNENNTLTIKSRCFDKTIVINLDDKDEIVDEVLNILKRRISVNKLNIVKEPDEG